MKDKFYIRILRENKISHILLLLLNLILAFSRFYIIIEIGKITRGNFTSFEQIKSNIVLIVISIILIEITRPLTSFIVDNLEIYIKKNFFGYWKNNFNFEVDDLSDKLIQDDIDSSIKFINNLKRLYANINTSIANYVFLLMMFIYFLKVNIYIDLFMILFAILFSILKIKSLNKNKGIWIRYRSNMRISDRLNELMINKIDYNERALFNTFNFINDKFNESFDNATYKNKIDGKKRLIYDLILDIFIVMLAFFVILYITKSFMYSDMTLENVFIIFSFNMYFINIISDELNKLNDYRNYKEEYETIEKVLNKKKRDKININIDNDFIIKCKNVYFKYPNSDKYVIKNLSYEFKKESYVLVGRNGEGKSTFIKLLCGFYKPNKGSISINGVNVYDLKDSKKSEIFSILLQTPNKYPLTIKDNIIFGNDNLSISKDIYDIVESFPYGIDSNVNENYDNHINLSSGQWQKIFFERARLQSEKILILDEPTASLDPIAELQFYRKISNLSKDKISIFVSHRLGIVNYAQKILLMENGSIEESGTFYDLYKKKGKFYEMYESQKSLYE